MSAWHTLTPGYTKGVIKKHVGHHLTKNNILYIIYENITYITQITTWLR